MTESTGDIERMTDEIRNLAWEQAGRLQKIETKLEQLIAIELERNAIEMNSLEQNLRRLDKNNEWQKLISNNTASNGWLILVIVITQIVACWHFWR